MQLRYLSFFVFLHQNPGNPFNGQNKGTFFAKLMRIFTVSVIIHRQGRISQGTSAAAWFKSKDQNRNYSTLFRVGVF